MFTPSTITIAQNGTGQVAVAIPVTEGESQLVKFKVSGLPYNSYRMGWWGSRITGIRVQFNPEEVPSGAGTTMNILTGNTPPGVYTITVEAQGKVSSHTNTLTVTVTPSDFSL